MLAEAIICELRALLTRRAATLTVSPMAVYCTRSADPMLPTTASPQCRPMPMWIGGASRCTLA